VRRDETGRATTGAKETRTTDLEIILDSINDGVFTVDADFTVTSFNHAAEIITGVRREAALGQPCWEVFRADICEEKCALKHTMATGRSIVNKPVAILNAVRGRVSISVSTALLRDRTGEVIGGVETFRDLSLVEALRDQVERRFAFHDMVTANHKMREMLALLPAIAESDSTVLISGESGTGKELLARAVHSLSARAARPLVAINCGALPDALLESELFGYVAGAFTDARRDKPGRLAAAQGGTLFLDEIGDVSPALQVRLLRVIQERTYEPLGSNTPVRADVRFVAATHRDLRAEVAAGRFREDLFYRLQVVQLAISPLRERPEDIPPLVRHIIDRLNRLKGRDIEGLSPEAMGCLMRHDWPGNVRELENAIEHAFVLCRQALIQVGHLPPDMVEATAAKCHTPLEAPARLADLERSHILAVLDRHGGNKSAAARALGIHKTTLWRKLRSMERHEGSPARGQTRPS
jgi:PAS domain S-box-containing protein